LISDKYDLEIFKIALNKLDNLIKNRQGIEPGDHVIIDNLRDGGVTLNEDILIRLFK
jgi:hypothetical protein